LLVAAFSAVTFGVVEFNFTADPFAAALALTGEPDAGGDEV